VRSVREATAAGPTWAEVGAHMHWKYAEGNFKLARLVATGVLSATREARSLDVPPMGTSAGDRLTVAPAELQPTSDSSHLGQSA